ncbi:MAG: iron uptake porin [Stenomitos rutilans HA7619-LM2]|nr:iron uptake porin [Stenomitos rutilans HA7619-LM2]
MLSYVGEQSAIAAPNQTADRPQAVDSTPDLLSQSITQGVVAEGSVDAGSADEDPMPQVTSVSQLSDVRPTDWAFQALQSLVERYGCIVGYPDRTFRGNRALTRYEFAAGLNACMDRINELIAAGTTNLVKKEDLVALQRLQEEFTAELATLRGRIGALEVQTATLERQQFSTTTKLSGELIFGAISVLAGDRADGTRADRVPTLGYRVRLNLETSFSGRDLLTTRLQANNVTPLGGTTVTGGGLGALLTNEGRIEFDGDSRGSLGIGLLRYRFPIGSRTNIYLAGAGNGFVDIDASQQLNPYFDGGAVSLFGLRNSIYNYSGGTGFGLRHFFNDTLELNLGYLVPNANDPSAKNGLFNGQYGALAQLIVNLSPSSRIGFTYVNAYSPFPDRIQPDIASSLGATGSNLANSNFGTSVSTNAFGFSGSINFNPRISLAGWVGYAQQRYIGRGDGDIWNWMVGLAFPDLGRKGDLGGILVGMEPKLTNLTNGVNGGQADRDTSLHVEGFYRFRLSDNIAITPGVIWLTAPNHDDRNDDVFIGVLRTVFYF